MANLLRTAKSGRDWGRSELRAYNIAVEYQGAATFFGNNPLPQPTVAAEVLHNVAAEDMVDEGNYTLLRYMDLAMNPVPAQESAVDDFTIELLRTLGYARRPRVTRSRLDIPFFICGEQHHARTDVCIVDSTEILLLIQEDKRHMEEKDPEPQLIAEAIAAFQANNDKRTRILAQDPIAHKILPGIIMTGTSPVFYKIPVTTELADSVSMGQYSPTRTVVHAHLPPVPRPARRLSEGMRPLDNRVTILACYEAFKQFVK
ncbi:hypothetical protein IW261DRAFT_1372952 [Armillaria novae-zelandiae]|uniref:Uncharacterized protein n=1 Tax=Armillaria novae-zelandiae TaxID=153914 RepID=A0AA39NMW3_9AGAR|nr:hypothetical protein IW261DRAFT_1372952 [Armillaria novae-zelandiae]